MTKRVLFVTLAALALLTVCVSVSFASAFYEGRPAQFDPGDSSGYFIWHDSRGWNLITTAEGRREHHFSGTIRTDGEIQNVKAMRLERGDRLRPDYRKDSIQFSFRSNEQEDGIHFNISGERYVQFELYIDGRRVDPRFIFVGRQGWRPSQSPFRIDVN